MVAQLTYVANCWVVPVHGITEEQMLLLRPLLEASPGIESVERTKSTQTSSCWDVLCKKASFNNVRVTDRSALENYESDTPTPDTPTPKEKMPFGWKKWSEIHITDDDSQGEQSFMTTSTQSFASIVTDTARENESITQGMVFDMTVVETAAPAPTYTTIEPKAAENHEAAHNMHILTAHIKQQDEKIARLKELITKQANTPTTPHPINTAADATATDEPQALTQAASTILTSVHKARIVQMEIQFQTKFDTLLQAMAFMNAKMDTIMDDRTKRDHDDLLTAASSLDQASKKTDNKSTPTKPSNSTQSPSLEGAEKNLFS
jgi:hypothetical protein